ncbi:MAG: histone [Nanobdellota archaeon]
MVKKIPLASMERIIREAGAEIVSEDSKEVLREELESWTKEIIRKASGFARYGKRNTIMKKDIILALEKND